VYQASLPDCNCKAGEFVVPCNSLPSDIDIRCDDDPVVVVTPTNTGSTVPFFPLLESPLTTGINVDITSDTKIYALYDSTSLGGSYITILKNRVEDWLVSNNLPITGVTNSNVGDERWLGWPTKVYTGSLGASVPTPAYSDNVLIIIFQDEANGGYHGSNVNGTIPATGPYQQDYNSFMTTHSQITGTFNVVLYPTCQGNCSSSNRRTFARQTFQAVSSGNNSPLDGMWQTGDAPRPAADGGVAGGVPDLCENMNLNALEQNNPYWTGTVPTYGGLDQFGWKINIRFAPVSSATLISDLNNLL